MSVAPIGPAPRRRPAFASIALPLLATLVLCLQGCASDGATSPGDGDAPPDAAELQRIVRTAIAGNDAVNVRLVNGVAIVSGDIDRADDKEAIIRALEEVDGVERVESYLQWRM